jgi:hypothetical protein
MSSSALPKYTLLLAVKGIELKPTHYSESIKYFEFHR